MDGMSPARAWVFAVALAGGCSANDKPQLIFVGGQGAGGQPAALQSMQSGSGQAGAGQAGTAQALPASGDVGFATTVQPFINKACNCHQSTPILMAPFSLKVGEAYGNLVNVPSIQVPAMMRIKPGSTDQSYLWHKVDGTQLQVGGSGTIMPATLPLSADEKLIFQRWIAAGAPP